TYDAALRAREELHSLATEQRDFQLGLAFARAAEPPLEIARAASDVADLAAAIAEGGAPRVRADAQAAAALAAGIARGAVAIVEAIATARGHGDLSENFEYHAAKNEQGLLERRITILRSRLQHAEVIDEAEAAASGVVTVGTTVELEREDGERMTVEISSVGG